MSWHRFWKNVAVNSGRAVRRTPPLRVERLEGRDLPSAPVPADIVSWYRAEGDASDFVGDNDGTLLNGATFTAGKVGQAFLLDGVDDLISIPDDPSLEPSSNFTIEAWVNPSSSGHGRPIAEKRRGQWQRVHLRDHSRAVWPERRIAIRRVHRRRAAELPPNSGRCPAQQHLATCGGNLQRHGAADLCRRCSPG